MNKRIELTEAVFENKNLILQPKNFPSGVEDVKAKGQVLVDSDHLAFIYILESGEKFVYASLPHTVWRELKEAKDNRQKVILQLKDQKIELVELFAELDDLLENIKGNANYGEDMEKQVVELFSLS